MARPGLGRLWHQAIQGGHTECKHGQRAVFGTSSANATTQDLLPILALTQSVAVKDLAATALRNCEQDTIFLLHGWDAQHYNLLVLHGLPEALPSFSPASWRAKWGQRGFPER